MQRNMNRSIPAGEAMDIAKQVLIAMLMLILLSVLIPVRAEEAVSPMIVSETANSTEYPALEADSRPPGLTAPALCAGYSASRGSMIPVGWVQKGCIRSARMSAGTRRVPVI